MAFMPQVVVAQVIVVIFYLKIIFLEVVALTNFMDITIPIIGLYRIIRSMVTQILHMVFISKEVIMQK